MDARDLMTNDQISVQALLSAAGNLEALAALKAIAEGHNDPSAVAKAALKKAGLQ